MKNLGTAPDQMAVCQLILRPWTTSTAIQWLDNLLDLDNMVESIDWIKNIKLRESMCLNYQIKGKSNGCNGCV